MFDLGQYVFYKEPMNLRDIPKKSGKLLCRIPQNYCGEVTEINGNWGKMTVDGIEGWCCISECFAKNLVDPKDENNIYYAKYIELKNKYEEMCEKTDKIKAILR